MTIVRYDAGLSQRIDSTAVERIAGGHEFTEGPVWHPDGYLLYSDIPADRICFWAGEGVKTFRRPSGHSNGLSLDRQLRLVACEHGTRRVSRTEPDGARITVADRFQGKRLNSPNDVVVRCDGSIFFTDPPYGCPDDARELSVQGVYRVSPDGKLHLEVDSMERPNGLAFSRDESVLYVDDSARREVRAFDVRSDGSLSSGRLFAEMRSDADGSPDGMKLDIEGRLFVTGPEGVWTFDPDGRRLGVLVTPEKPSNCCWGDADRQALYITARSSVYRIRMKAPGLVAW
jgi:sugar lactone lactonase YvrE